MVLLKEKKNAERRLEALSTNIVSFVRGAAGLLRQASLF